MSVTFGFYNSLNGDRRYNAVQMSHIFDGLVTDGVYMHVGSHFMVSIDEKGMILVGSGRAWFNHTWTLNDANLLIAPLESELVLSRIDAVVIEVNSSDEVRANAIKIIKGTPSANPARPTMVHTETLNQYPLAYVTVPANSSKLTPANLQVVIGTSECPYVTGIISGVSVDYLYNNWRNEWDTFFNAQKTDTTAAKEAWKTQLQEFYRNLTTSTDAAINGWEADVNNFLNEKTALVNNNITRWDTALQEYYDQETANMAATADRWKAQWKEWYDSYTGTSEQEFSDWMAAQEAIYEQWFTEIKETLTDDVAINLYNKIELLKDEVTAQINNVETAVNEEIEELKRRATALEHLTGTLATEFLIDQDLTDSDGNPILDTTNQAIQGRIRYQIL